jgi:4-hydroxy-3-polyprenylbenzoate decarboxylase
MNATFGAMVGKRIVVAITGASGAIYGIRTLEILRERSDTETHLVISDSGRATIAQETRRSIEEVRSLADVVHPFRELGASIASGSFRTDGMLVAPCSIRTLSAIANCATGDLVSRAADVVLKERRRLVLLVRETPLHAGHLRLMLQATENGAIVMPPVPAFYAEPASIEALVDHTVGRALDLLGIDTELVSRWDGMGNWAARQSSVPGDR